MKDFFNGFTSSYSRSFSRRQQHNPGVDFRAFGLPDTILPAGVYRHIRPDTMEAAPFAALYLDVQDARTLTEWHDELASGLGRRHWVDTLDFWSQLRACRVIEDIASKADYQQFLLEIAEFDISIFATAYGHAIRLRQAGLLQLDDEFRNRAELLLADASRTA